MNGGNTILMKRALGLAISLLLLSLHTSRAAEPQSPASTRSIAKDSRLFELRTYYAAPGKLEALHARFRDHTNKLFIKHGMELVGYWVPADQEHGERLIYILAHKDRDAAKKSWKEFQNDPDWIKARTASELNGKLVEKVDSVYMLATDYSPMK